MDQKLRQGIKCFCSGLITPLGKVTAFDRFSDGTFLVQVGTKELIVDLQTLLALNPRKQEFLKAFSGDAFKPIRKTGNPNNLGRHSSRRHSYRPASEAERLGLTAVTWQNSQRERLLRQQARAEAAEIEFQLEVREREASEELDRLAAAEEVELRAELRARLRAELDALYPDMVVDPPPPDGRKMRAIVDSCRMIREQEREKLPFWKDPERQWAD